MFNSLHDVFMGILATPVVMFIIFGYFTRTPKSESK